MAHLVGGQQQIGGAAVADHLASVAAQTGANPDPAPEVRAEEAYLLDVWTELNGARGDGFNGAMPIAFTEIEAWTRLRKFPLSAWEVSVLRAMDDAAIRKHRAGQGD